MFDSLPRLGAAAASTSFEIDRSLRFNKDDSAVLIYTPGGAGDSRQMTFSFWAKRGSLGNDSYTNYIWTAWNGSNTDRISFTSDDQLQIELKDGNSTEAEWHTDKLFRDPTAWYHIVVAFDTEQSTVANRMKLYINGTLITDFDLNDTVGQNYDLEGFNTTNEHSIGRYQSGSTGGNTYFDGYLAEVNFIDGTQNAVTDFGEIDADTGQWVPKKYTGSYGTRGFYLDFKDNSNTTAATLGKDSSGNGHNVTPTNFSIAAGTGNDSLADTPTNNFATLNQLAPNHVTISNGNLDWNTGTAQDCASTFGFTSGKWYAELTCAGDGQGSMVGIKNEINERMNGGDANTICTVTSTGTQYSESSTADVTTGGTWTTNDIIGIALDATSKTCDIYKNGSKIWGFTSFTVDGPYYFVFDRVTAAGSSFTHSVNFGQRAFSHQVSTYNSLCTANLSEPTIKKADEHFDTVLYTGDGTATTITGLNFAPNLVWIKGRSDITNHRISDTIRGTGISLVSNDTRSDDTTSYSVSAFTSDGWTTTSGAGDTNTNNSTFVAWNWKGGTAGSGNTTAPTGTAKTYTSNYNATAGFSITRYTGNGTAGHQIPHSLGVVPDVIIVKRTNDTEDWAILCGGIEGNAGFYIKFETGGGSNAAAGFNQTNPTSSVFTLGDNNISNGDGSTYIAYAFSSIAGYSKFGKYTGNGADNGPYVDLGFRPAMIFTKRLDGTSNWYTFDNKRETYNVRDYRLELQSTGVEYGPYDNRWDFLSRGMKLRSLNAGSNASGSPFLYMAWADLPGKYTNAG